MQDNETKRNYQNKTKTVLKQKKRKVLGGGSGLGNRNRNRNWQRKMQERCMSNACGGKSKQFLQQLR